MIGLLAACGPPRAPAADRGRDDLVALPGGTFTRGRDDAHELDQRPAHQVTVSGFAIERTLVTVAAFRGFVEATGYVTSAERLGFGMVAREGMPDWAWEEVPRATWRAPWGPGGGFDPGDDHPVVQVSWTDAATYCAWRGRRLPTEAEWEYAMRAGTEGARFPWGDEPVVDGRYRLNYWQGDDHVANAHPGDGWLYTSPVWAFPPNAFGLYDPVGNTWQWTADWYAADTYARSAPAVTDPHGPPTGTRRVARGGSWWCSPSSCSAYGLWARGKTSPEAPFANNGFRCAASEQEARGGGPT